MKLRVLVSAVLAASVGLGSVSVVANESDAVSQGFAAFDQGKPQDAEAIFTKLIESPEHKSQGLMYMSWLYLAQGKTESAIEHIEQALKVEPNTAEELTLSGDIYCNHAQRSSMFSALKMAKKCIAQYEEAVKLEPENVDALMTAMQFYLAAPSIAGGSTEKGNALLEKLKTLSPEHAATYKVAELDKAEKTDEALAVADELTKKGFNTATNQYMIAHFYRDRKQYDKALPLFASMNKFSETTRNRWFIRDSLLQQGEILMIDNRDLPAAIKLIEEYKQKNKNPGDPHYFWSTWSLAKAYQSAGNHGKYDELVAQIESEDYESNKEFTKQFEKRK
jgi:tetratricopeptide (TPR) repeat protein